jgi:hypothetical protein
MWWVPLAAAAINTYGGSGGGGGGGSKVPASSATGGFVDSSGWHVNISGSGLNLQSGGDSMTLIVLAGVMLVAETWNKK